MRDSGSVVYAIEGGGGNARLFSIDPASGWISAARELDRESVPEHLLMVSATDVSGGTEPRRAVRKLILNNF